MTEFFYNFIVTVIVLFLIFVFYFLLLVAFWTQNISKER